MVFNSIEFLLFFSAFFLVYWTLATKSVTHQNVFLLLGSAFFYAWVDWRFLFLLFGFSIITYSIAKKINVESQERKKYHYFLFGLFCLLANLFFFKYFNFFISNVQTLLNGFGFNAHLPTIKVMLPLGISFYTFRLLSYLIDVYKEKMEPTKDWISFFVYVSFFPSLISGPIDRANTFLPQLSNGRVFDSKKFSDGLRQILWGLFKKTVIADNCAMLTDHVYSDYAHQSGSTLFIAAILYAVQLYADFSGYSDMAIGVAKLLGFKGTVNFRYPYFAENITEYWRRWHISLTSWLTEYIFTPLSIAFRDLGKWGLWIAIFINFLAVGWWHGANWTFAFFGLINAIYYLPYILKGKVFQKNKGDNMIPSLRQVLNISSTFLLVSFMEIFFRSETLSDAFGYVSGICTKSFFTIPVVNIGNTAKFTLFFIPFFFVAEWVQKKKEHPLQIESIKSYSLRFSIYLFLVLIIVYFGAFSNAKFIYFQF